ncbi:comF family protein [Parabacteroides chinchillae]|uniref:ComF family protein n=1 Tax=Parabacteroides chinchillae TaxID=871327 RepID=A0A8G2BUL2_9BACT|nr:comF family protein [Parabacteroides chinchillae]
MPTILNDILNLFFPNLCRLCKKPLIDGENQICLNCLYDLPRTNFHKIKALNPAEQLFMDNPNIVHAYSFLYYGKGGNVQKLIHSLKYYDNKELGYLLGRQAALELQKVNSPLCKTELLLPVPLHPRKQKQRGYNQSEWIALGLSSVWNTPINMSVLQRTKESDTQTHRTTYNRWINVKDIFAVQNTDELKGKHILLIDDVITTGSTISGCIKALHVVPGLQISVFSVAIA